MNEKCLELRGIKPIVSIAAVIRNFEIEFLGYNDTAAEPGDGKMFHGVLHKCLSR